MIVVYLLGMVGWASVFQLVIPILLAHPLYGLPKPCALAICAQTVEILAFAELGRGSHKVTWGTPQWFWWMGFLKVG